MTKNIQFIYLITFLSLMHSTLFAQDLEPRRWTPLPSGTTILGLTYAHTSGDLGLDPVLEIEDAKVKRESLVMSYTHFFTFAEKLMRFDAILPWANTKWDGLLRGEQDDAQRIDISDPRFRLSINLLGAPASGSSKAGNTVVGTSIAVTVPWGEYYDDKLLNLGSNRYTIRPQIGVVHTRGPWSYELTGSIFFFTDNDRFFNGNKFEQDPFYAVQGHIIRVFDPGVWGSLSAGYGEGSARKINGISKKDRLDGFITALSFGVPLTPDQGLKFSYIWSKLDAPTQTRSNLNTFTVGWSIRL